MIVDDDALVRLSLVQILRLDNDIAVVGEASSGNDALAQLLEINPDVVLLDIRMPDGDGLSTLSEIRQKVKSRVVV
ncbi:response regulator transcription factor [uncultured Schumannella sp.]|uniref:response regulator transcription factor n=1 Tax=uncultured Schumannella sp. TaxID=1195956 RepID=UPI0025F8BCFC|nr:response regulator transcription factor [uncultured Schumannella sp.]